MALGSLLDVPMFNVNFMSSIKTTVAVTLFGKMLDITGLYRYDRDKN